MAIRWHKHDVVLHMKGGQSVKIPAFALSIKKIGGDHLTGYKIQHPWRCPRELFYSRIDSIDAIELRNRPWWRWL